MIAIIGVLIALLLPAVQAAREAARRTQCLNQVRQVALALHNFADTNGAFPKAADETTYSYVVEVAPFFEQGNLVSALDETLPYDNAANQRVLGESVIENLKCPSAPAAELLRGLGGGGGGGVGGFGAVGTGPATQEGFGRNHYLAVMGAKDLNPSADSPNFNDPDADDCRAGEPFEVIGNCNTGGLAVNGVMDTFRRNSFRRIIDGTSNTLLIGEVAWEAGEFLPWYAGVEEVDSVTATGSSGSGTREAEGFAAERTIHSGKNVANRPNDGVVDGSQAALSADDSIARVPANDAGFGSRHPGVTHFALADGSARSLNDDIDVDVYRLLACRNDERVVDIDQ